MKKKFFSLLVLVSVIFLATGCNTKRIIMNKNTNNTSSGNVQVNDNKNTADSKSSTNTKGIEVKIGQNIEYADHYNISFEETLFSKKVEPTNPDSYYYYYEPKDSNNNTYLVLKTVIKNLATETLDGEKLPSPKVIYDNKYTYNASAITEEDDGSDLKGYSWYMDIDPLKTKKIWYLVEVPNEIETNTNANLIFQFQVDGKTYNIKVR